MVSIVQPTRGTNQANLKTARSDAYDGQRQFSTSRNRFWWVSWQVLNQNPISTNPINLQPPKVVILCNLRHSLVKSVKVSCRFDEISLNLAEFWPNLLLSDSDRDRPPPDKYLEKREQTQCAKLVRGYARTELWWD